MLAVADSFTVAVSDTGFNVLDVMSTRATEVTVGSGTGAPVAGSVQSGYCRLHLTTS